MTPIHEQTLLAARRLCRARSDWTFTPVEVVRALPHLNERSVRTHIVSRCCVNAPRHHQHRYKYFRRVARGVYQIEPRFRSAQSTSSLVSQQTGPADHVREAAPVYEVDDSDLRGTVHAVIFESGQYYVAECLEVAVVTQGRSLDETVANLREAVTLHLSNGDSAHLGLSPTPRVVISYESAPVGL